MIYFLTYPHFSIPVLLFTSPLAKIVLNFSCIFSFFLYLSFFDMFLYHVLPHGLSWTHYFYNFYSYQVTTRICVPFYFYIFDRFPANLLIMKQSIILRCTSMIYFFISLFLIFVFDITTSFIIPRSINILQYRFLFFLNLSIFTLPLHYSLLFICPFLNVFFDIHIPFISPNTMIFPVRLSSCCALQ